MAARTLTLKVDITSLADAMAGVSRVIEVDDDAGIEQVETVEPPIETARCCAWTKEKVDAILSAITGPKAKGYIGKDGQFIPHNCA